MKKATKTIYLLAAVLCAALLVFAVSCVNNVNDSPFIGEWVNAAGDVLQFNGSEGWGKASWNFDGKMWGTWKWNGGSTAILDYNGEELRATISGDRITWMQVVFTRVGGAGSPSTVTGGGGAG